MTFLFQKKRCLAPLIWRKLRANDLAAGFFIFYLFIYLFIFFFENLWFFTYIHFSRTAWCIILKFIDNFIVLCGINPHLCVLGNSQSSLRLKQVKKGPVMPSLKKRYVFLYCIVLYLASLARAVNSPAGSKGLFFRVTYSTLFPVFPSQLWPVFYLESGTHGKMGSIYKHGRWGIGVGGGAALGNSWLFAFTFSPPCPVIRWDVEFTGFLPMREIWNFFPQKQERSSYFPQKLN